MGDDAVLDLSRNKTQRDFVLNPFEVSAFYGGIRNGKTIGGCARVLLLADLWPGNVILVGRKTYQELRDTTWNELLIMVRKRNGGTLEPGPYVARCTMSIPPEIELTNGSKILGRYADNIESILSLTLGAAYLDQAEFVDEAVFTHLETRLMLWTDERIAEAKKKHLELYGQPMTGTPRGFIFVSGNPRMGWVHRRFKLGMKPDGTPYPPNSQKLFEASTEENRHNLPPGYIERMLTTQSAAFVTRFVSGDWTAFEGQVFTEYLESLHTLTIKDLPWTKPPAHWPRSIGMDHGQRVPTAAIFMAQDPKGYILTYNEHYKVSTQIKDHAESILELAKGDAVPRPPDGKGVLVHLDPAVKGDYTPEGIDFSELYGKLGIHSLKTNKNVNAGIQRIQELLHPDPTRPFPDWHPRKGQLGSPLMFILRDRCPGLVTEAPLYEWEPSKDGAAPREKPLKHNDHALDAWRYGIMGLGEAKPQAVAAKRPTFAEQMHKRLLKLGDDEETGPGSGPTILDGR